MTDTGNCGPIPASLLSSGRSALEQRFVKALFPSLGAAGLGDLALTLCLALHRFLGCSPRALPARGIPTWCEHPAPRAQRWTVPPLRAPRDAGSLEKTMSKTRRSPTCLPSGQRSKSRVLQQRVMRNSVTPLCAGLAANGRGKVRFPRVRSELFCS